MPTTRRVRLCVSSNIVPCSVRQEKGFGDDEWIGYWSVVPEECRTVGDWEEHVRANVLGGATSEALDISIESFSLSRWESVSVIREEDLVVVCASKDRSTRGFGATLDVRDQTAYRFGGIGYVSGPTAQDRAVLPCDAEPPAVEQRKNSRSARRKSRRRRLLRESKLRLRECTTNANVPKTANNSKNADPSVQPRSGEEIAGVAAIMDEPKTNHEEHSKAVSLDSTMPGLGDRIRFRVLELSQSFEPVISDFYVAKIINYEKENGVVVVDRSIVTQGMRWKDCEDDTIRIDLAELRDVTIDRESFGDKFTKKNEYKERTAEEHTTKIELHSIAQPENMFSSEYVTTTAVDQKRESGMGVQCRVAGPLWPVLQCLRENGDLQ